MENPLRNWNQAIINKYFETLDLSNRVTQTIDSNKFGKARFMAFYQPYKVPGQFLTSRLRIMDRVDSLDYVFDVSASV